MHNECRVGEVISCAELIGITPTEIVTGCWLGVDHTASEYARKNGFKSTKLDLRSKILPDGIDAIILITLNGLDPEHQWLIDTADIIGTPILVW